MKILALETTGKYGSAAVIDENGRISCSSSSGEMNHLTDIIGLIGECLEKHGLEKQDIDHVAASIGPGSFTGIRIGVSTARALSQSWGIPCIAVRTLEGMLTGAIDHLEDLGLELTEDIYICPIINARRHQTYGALWKISGDHRYHDVEEVLPQAQYMIEEILERTKKLKGMVVFTGDGIDAYESIIMGGVPSNEELPGYILMPVEYRYQSAGPVAMIALGKVRSGETVGYEELMPDYMRKSEAEMRLEEGTLSSKIKG